MTGGDCAEAGWNTSLGLPHELGYPMPDPALALVPLCGLNPLNEYGLEPAPLGLEPIVLYPLVGLLRGCDA